MNPYRFQTHLQPSLPLCPAADQADRRQADVTAAAALLKAERDALPLGQ